MSENANQSIPITPVELSAEIDATLKSLLVQVGQSLRAKSRLQSALRLLQAKAASGSHQLTKEEVIVLQQYQHGQGQGIPGLKALEQECFKYNGLVKELGTWISRAKEALEEEMEKAKAREEVEREQQRVREEEEEVKRVAEEKVKMEMEAEAARKAQEAQSAKAFDATAQEKAVESKEGDAIIIDDDDDDDDDVPLAGRSGVAEGKPSTEGNSTAIDLTDDSPLGGKKMLLETENPPNNAPAPLASSQAMPMPDSAALIASLTGMGAADNNEQDPTGAAAMTTSLALDNFDFSQMELQQMDGLTGFGSGTQGQDYSSDQLDGFNMDFLDFSAMGGDDMNGGTGGMVDSSNLFGNIDFSSILNGGLNDAKKE
jgi:hypothetical protein